MDGKHRGTGSTSAVIEVQRGKEKRRKRVNFTQEERGEEKTGESKVRSKETTGESEQ